MPSIGSTLLGTGVWSKLGPHETQLKSFLPSTKPNFAFDFERVFLST